MDDSELRFVRGVLDSVAFAEAFRLADPGLDDPPSVAAFPNVQLGNGDVLEGAVVAHRAAALCNRTEINGADVSRIEIALGAVDAAATDALGGFNGAFAGARAARLAARCFRGLTWLHTGASAELDRTLFGCVAAMARLRILPPVACAGFEDAAKTAIRIRYCKPIVHSDGGVQILQDVVDWNEVRDREDGDAFRLALDAALVALVDRAASLGMWPVFSELAKAGVAVVRLATDPDDATQVAYATLPEASYGAISTGVHIANVDEREYDTDEARFLMLFDLCSLRWPDDDQTTSMGKWDLASPLAAACLALAVRFGSDVALFTKSIVDASRQEYAQRYPDAPALAPPKRVSSTPSSVARPDDDSPSDSSDESDDALPGLGDKLVFAETDSESDSDGDNGLPSEKPGGVVAARYKKSRASKLAQGDEDDDGGGAADEDEPGRDLSTVDARRKKGEARRAGADADEANGGAVSDAEDLAAAEFPNLNRPTGPDRRRTDPSATTPTAPERPETVAPSVAPSVAPEAAPTLVFPRRDSDGDPHAYQKSRIAAGKFDNKKDVPLWWADTRNKVEQQARADQMKKRILHFFKSKPGDVTGKNNPFDRTLVEAYAALDQKQADASTKTVSELKAATKPTKPTKPVWDHATALEARDSRYWKKPKQDVNDDTLTAKMDRLLAFYAKQYYPKGKDKILPLRNKLNEAAKLTAERRVMLDKLKRRQEDAKAATVTTQTTVTKRGRDLERVNDDETSTAEEIEKAQSNLREAKAAKEAADKQFGEMDLAEDKQVATDEINKALLAESEIVSKMVAPVQELVELRKKTLKDQLKALVTTGNQMDPLLVDEKDAFENERELLEQLDKITRVFASMDTENLKFEGSDSPALLFRALYKSTVPELAKAVGRVREIRTLDDEIKRGFADPAERVRQLFEDADMLNVHALLYNYVWNLTKQENTRPMWDFSTVILHATQVAVGRDGAKLAKSSKTEKTGILFYLVQLMIDAVDKDDTKTQQLVRLGRLADKIRVALGPLKDRGLRVLGGTTRFPAQLLIGEVANAIAVRREAIVSLLSVWPKRQETSAPKVSAAAAVLPTTQNGVPTTPSVAFASAFSTGPPATQPPIPGSAPAPPPPPAPPPKPPPAPPKPPPKPPPAPPAPPPPNSSGGGGGGGGGGNLSMAEELRQRKEAKEKRDAERLRKQEEERAAGAADAKGANDAAAEAAAEMPRDQDPAFKIPPLFFDEEAEAIQKTLFIASDDPIWKSADDACRELCEFAGFRLPSSLKETKEGEEHKNPDFAFGMAMLSYALGIAVAQHLSADRISDECGIEECFRVDALRELFPSPSQNNPERQFLGFFPMKSSALRRSLPDAPVRSLARPMLALRGDGVATFGQSQPRFGVGARALMARELRMVQMVDAANTKNGCFVLESGGAADSDLLDELMSGTSPFTKRVLTQQTRFGCDQVGAWLKPGAEDLYTDLVDEIVDADPVGDKAVLLVAMLVARHAFVSVDAES